ncbi:MAG: MBL fold metallo-hydrolase [Desulfohalobiaceae bacterium]
MSDKLLTVLGTASQVPTKKRNHIGCFLQWKGSFFLFDPGEGTQRQLLLYDLPYSRISKIFISHFHGDHCLGLPGVIQRLSLAAVEQELEIYYPASGQRFVRNLLGCASFHNRLRIKEIPVQESGLICSQEGLQIQARQLSHTLESWGYRVQEPDAWTVQPGLLPQGLTGRLVGRLKQEGSLEFAGRVVRLQDVAVHKPGYSLAYVLDTRYCQAALDLALEADMLVTESTYLESELQLAENYGHLTAAQAARLAREAKVSRLVLLHFSQRYHSLAGFREEAEALHPDLVVARDGEQVALPARRRDLG